MRDGRGETGRCEAAVGGAMRGERGVRGGTGRGEARRDGRGGCGRDGETRAWAGRCVVAVGGTRRGERGRGEAGVGRAMRGLASGAGRRETGRAGRSRTSRVGQARRCDEVAARSQLLAVAAPPCGLSLAPSRGARSLGQPAGRGRAARRAGQIWGRLGASGTAPRAARAGRCRLPEALAGQVRVSGPGNQAGACGL